MFSSAGEPFLQLYDIQYKPVHMKGDGIYSTDGTNVTPNGEGILGVPRGTRTFHLFNTKRDDMILCARCALDDDTEIVTGMLVFNSTFKNDGKRRQCLNAVTIAIDNENPMKMPPFVNVATIDIQIPVLFKVNCNALFIHGNILGDFDPSLSEEPMCQDIVVIYLILRNPRNENEEQDSRNLELIKKCFLHKQEHMTCIDNIVTIDDTKFRALTLK